jgi:hypothetical protein
MRSAGRRAAISGRATATEKARVCSNDAVKSWLPWLAVLALIMVLSALRLRPLATAVAAGWLVYCVYTWIRFGRARRNGDRTG